MSARYLTLSQFVHAVDAFVEAATALDNQHASEEQKILGLVQYAPDVIRSASLLLNREAVDEFAIVRFDLGKARLLDEMPADAETEGDVEAANLYRDAADRMRVHIARRIVAALRGEQQTALERQLRASVAKNERALTGKEVREKLDAHRRDVLRSVHDETCFVNMSGTLVSLGEEGYIQLRKDGKQGRSGCPWELTAQGLEEIGANDTTTNVVPMKAGA